MSFNLVCTQLLNGTAVGMLYALMAFGLSIIKGLLNIPNFAHGAFYAVGAYVCFSAYERTGSFWLGLLCGFFASGIVGMVIERFGVGKLLASAYLFQLLLLFGVALMLEQAIILVWGAGGNSKSPPEFLQGAVDLGITLYPRYLLFIAVASAVIITAVWFLIEKTKFGAYIRAGIDKKEMAQALGINIDALFTLGFGLGAGLAGLAGGLAVPLVGVTATMGTDMLSIAFVVVVIGGLGSIYGAIPAGLIAGIVQSLVTIWAAELSTVMIYVAMLVVLAWRPQGLLGER
jgi:branched-chain amino acid transport system permease protein